ncbi:MAG: menaquinone biosynthesis protein [Bryobacteraceae bacterium]
MESKPRVCVVNFLNTVPLVWGMLHGKQQDTFDLSFCLPAECADRLQDGRADIGIVPAIELPRQDLLITADTAIACRGPVRSILLISKVPFGDIRTLAADSSSRTSVVLAEIVLRRKYDADPILRAHPPHLDAMLSKCDAALIIGDPALLIEPSQLPYRVLDLGQEWTDLTGLPMVFAVWAARRRYASEPFRDSLRFGMEHMDEIVESEYAKRSISEELAREYLTRNVTFDLGPSERAGLDLFLQYAREIHQTELRTVTA